MANITTDFDGTESAATVYSRLESIIDHYYGAGHYDTLLTRAAIRSAINDLQSSAYDFLADSELASSFITKLNRLNDPANLVPEAEAIIEASTGAFWDFSDASTVFETSGTSDPCEATDPIYTATARAVGGLATATWSQATLASRPVWQTTYAAFDGSNDEMNGESGGAASLFQNVGAGFLACSFRLDTLSADRVLLAFGQGVTATSDRFQLSITSTGALRALAYRADGGSLGFKDSTAGLITTGVDYTVLVSVDWATGGAGAFKGYINGGADVLNGTLAGSGNTSNTASLRTRLGVGLGGSARMDGRIYKAAAGSFIPSTVQRAILTGVLAP